jgi:hypothetical protein
MGEAGKIDVRGTLPKAWLGVPFGGNDLKGIVVVQSYNDRFIFKEKTNSCWYLSPNTYAMR